MTMTCPHCWGSKRAALSRRAPCTFCHGDGIVPDEQLSKNFLLSELLRSGAAQRLGLPNAPDATQLANLHRLTIELLEPVRLLVGPIHLDSGFRQPAVNKAVGGSATSAHILGLAGDCIPLERSRRSMADKVITSNIAFDQLIFEGSWVHLGLLGPRGEQRRQALMAFPKLGGAAYQPYDPTDPRVNT